jgi:hypothetical protein
MEFDTDKIDEDTLALLYNSTCATDNDGVPRRAWKGHAWDTMNRLFEKGLIDDPKDRNKSFWFTPEGGRRAKELFIAKYAKPPATNTTNATETFQPIQK